MSQAKKLIKNELDTVYITTDGRKFLKYMDAIYAESQLQFGIEMKNKKKEKNMDIIKLVMQVLKSENWGIFYKNQPIQPLELQGGDALYKVNQVDDSEIEERINEALTKGDTWEHSQTNSAQRKNSETG